MTMLLVAVWRVTQAACSVLHFVRLSPQRPAVCILVWEDQERNWGAPALVKCKLELLVPLNVHVQMQLAFLHESGWARLGLSKPHAAPCCSARWVSDLHGPQLTQLAAAPCGAKVFSMQGLLSHRCGGSALDLSGRVTLGASCCGAPTPMHPRQALHTTQRTAAPLWQALHTLAFLVAFTAA